MNLQDIHCIYIYVFTYFFGFNLTYNMVDKISKIKLCLQEKTSI